MYVGWWGFNEAQTELQSQDMLLRPNLTCATETINYVIMT
jgi:hypothetical protein